jgi:transcriptional regulator with XRE-family HTH domain
VGRAKGEPPPRSLGERLYEFRLLAGMTQAQVAEPRYTKAYVSMLEGGKGGSPSLTALRYFADRLGVAVGDLLGPEFGAFRRPAPTGKHQRPRQRLIAYHLAEIPTNELLSELQRRTTHVR